MKAWGMLYNAVVQLVLLYRSESWVVTGSMIEVLEGFHHWAARRITGMTVRRTTSGGWKWPLVAEALETSGIWTIKEYIKRRQDTVAYQVD